MSDGSKECQEPLVEFKKGSALEQFLIRKSENEIKTFTFQQILILLKNIMKSEELYDPRKSIYYSLLWRTRSRIQQESDSSQWVARISTLSDCERCRDRSAHKPTSEVLWNQTP